MRMFNSRRDSSALCCYRAPPVTTGLCFSARAAQEQRLKYCLSLGPGWPTWVWFILYFPFFVWQSAGTWRGHLNLTHHSTPHWRHAFDNGFKWIKLTFHQQLNASAENPPDVTVQICRDLGWANGCKRKLHLGAQGVGRKVFCEELLICTDSKQQDMAGLHF